MLLSHDEKGSREEGGLQLVLYWSAHCDQALRESSSCAIGYLHAGGFECDRTVYDVKTRGGCYRTCNAANQPKKW